MNNLYQDIAERTNGDIYVGVVGPVRSGKSTFVTNFIKNLVLPNISDENEKKRAIDDLPQSADGKTIMTTQIKFVPSSAIKVSLDEKCTANIRLIDCVGYLIDGAEGHLENGKSRLVDTPWSSEPLPFEKVAELGTHKVATEHSTVAVVVTTDGSFGDIQRNNYVEAEERTVKELQKHGKPFVIVLNTLNAENAQTLQLAKSLQDKYGVAVIPLNVQNATGAEMETVLKNILLEFPIRRVAINLPNWIRALDKDSKIVSHIIDKIKNCFSKVCKMKDVLTLSEVFGESEYVDNLSIINLNMGNGVVEIDIKIKDGVFYSVLSENAQVQIDDELSLMSFVQSAAFAKQKYDQLKGAFDQADASGYGIVCPDKSSINMQNPEMLKQGNVYAIKMKANAPSYHVIKVDVETEVSPMVGTEQQGKYMLEQFKQNPEQIWHTNMFGKTMSGLASDSLQSKCSAMPNEIKVKLTRTINKIVNENRGGLICFLL